MNKKEWLRRLELELHKLPDVEVQDAVAYYTEYFEEAGPENEASVIVELGQPQKVAAQIRADYATRILDEPDGSVKKHGKTRIGLIVAAIIGGIMAAPVAFPVALSLTIVAIMLIVGIGALIAGIIAAAVGGVALGVGLLVIGGTLITQTVAGSLLIMGSGLAIIGLGLLGVFILIKLTALLIHWLSKVLQERRKRKQNKIAGGYVPGGDVTETQSFASSEYAPEAAPAPAENISLTKWEETAEPAEAATAEPVEAEVPQAVAVEPADAEAAQEEVIGDEK